MIRSAALAATVASTLALQPWTMAQAGPLNPVPFPPAYPQPGGNHETWTATLPGLGLLLDGTTNRCDTDAEAGAEIASAVFLAIESAEYACHALPPGGEDVCFAGIFVSGVVSTANEIASNQCAFHDAIIDGAEIEAAYENSARIFDNLLEHDDNLATHDTDIKARLATLEGKIDVIDGKVDVLLGGQAEMVRLAHTPNGRRTSAYYPDACGDGDGCSWNE